MFLLYIVIIVIHIYHYLVQLVASLHSFILTLRTVSVVVLARRLILPSFQSLEDW